MRKHKFSRAISIVALLLVIVAAAALFSVSAAGEGVIRGDMNGDGKVDSSDAIHLLMYTFFGDMYPINQSGDLNDDGKVDSADATHLLMYTFFGDKVYPLACDHKEVIDAAKPATCTETGLTEGKHCSICGKVLVKQQVIPLSHDPDDTTATIVIAGDGSSAVTRRVCKKCAGYVDVPYTGYYVSGNSAYKFGEDGRREDITDVFIDFEEGTYYVVDNVVVKNYYIIDGKVYDFGDDGRMRDVEINNIYITINGDTYYVVNNVVVKNYYIIDGKVYYFGEDGKKRDGEINNVYITIDGDTYYVVNNVVVKNYYIIDGKVYDFGDDGKKRNTGITNTIVSIGGNKYYVVDNIIVVNIYVFYDGHIYRFGSDGEMLIGTEFDNYVFGESGELTSDGKTIYIEIDGSIYEVVGVVAVVHTHNYSENVVPATCKNKGYTEHTCRCGSKYIDDETPALAHNYVEGVCTKCGEAKASEGLIFTSNGDGTCYVMGIGSCTDTDIVIPTTSPAGDKVTCIGYRAFSECYSLQSVTIPYGVTCIDSGAFQFCYGLKSVTIPDSVTEIGGSAFLWCSSLSTISIPKSVTSIGKSMLLRCDNLTSITMPFVVSYFGRIFGADSYDDNEIYVPNTLKNVVIIGGSDINYRAFYGCTGLTSVVVLDGVKRIGGRAFENCSSLIDIIIPASVESIGVDVCKNTAYYYNGDNWNDGMLYIGSCLIEGNPTTIPADCMISSETKCIADAAFSGCGRLTSVTIPAGITSIGNGVFENCTNLSNVVLPDSIMNIGAGAFSGCANLTNILLPARVKTIGTGAFENCSKLVGITIPDGVTSIGAATFFGCTSLTNITIPNGVTGIGDRAFSRCTNLTKVSIPDSVTIIGYYAFSECANITSIVVPDNVVEIGYGAFEDCNGLTSIKLPFVGKEKNGSSNAFFGYIFGASGYDKTSKYVPRALKTVVITKDTRIGYNAFFGCTGIASITIPNGVTYIGSRAFYGCTSLTSIIIPDSVTSIGGFAFDCCSNLESITVGENNTNYCSKDGILYSKLSTAIVHIPLKISGNIKILDGVTHIEGFEQCSNLISVEIPDSVMTIGYHAFRYCNGLVSVTFGKNSNLKSIYGEAFSGCINFDNITIPNSVTSIGGNAFYYTAYYNNEANWTDGVLYIDNCLIKAKSDKISANYTVTAGTRCIADRAFSDCTSLAGITVPDSVTSIGDYAFSGTAYYKDEANWTDGVLYIGNHLIAAKSDKLAANYTVRAGTGCIADSAFSGCGNLTSITIPNSVTSIGDHAFSGCQRLVSITIPDGVTSIGSYAFGSCTSLADITFTGTKAQWDSVTKGYDWNSNTKSYTIHCTDGDISK